MGLQANLISGNVQTHYVRRPNGTDAVVIASKNKNELDELERSMTVDRKVVITKTDMNPEMMKAAITTVCDGLERFQSSQWSEIAGFTKREFESKYGNEWHCIVFTKGGYSILYDNGYFIRLDIGEYAVVLFRQ